MHDLLAKQPNTWATNKLCNTCTKNAVMEYLILVELLSIITKWHKNGKNWKV